ncbi:helix-turn-helix domain-containing protein [Streptomyces sp. NPDC008125]|uniref:helix-turn-helix domain-containing protein n=1 Tax=Streptomyces sp. NPDC008125 TaxID=3364811 RepID=UPI0036E71922
MTQIRDAASRPGADLPRLFTPEDVADALQVSAWWVRDQARRKRVDATKVGGSWRFTRAQFDQLLIHHASPAVPESTAPPRRSQSAPSQPPLLVPRLPGRMRG